MRIFGCMKTTVHISDFKDFPGLQEACMYFKSSMIYSSFNFYIFDEVNPYEAAFKFRNADWSRNNYSDAIEFAEENGFEVRNVISDLNGLIVNASYVIKRLISLCSYPEGHINRIY